MASPTTPLHKRLAIVDSRGNRASSTPPANRLNQHLLLPVISPSSRHSSPGIDHLLSTGRLHSNELIPRRLTMSPVPRLRDKDRTRKRLTQYHSVQHAVQLLKSAKNIVVLSGAGISTSLNIPDFRSSTGFYSHLPSHLSVTKPEEFFSVDFFKLQSEAFWDNVKPLLPRFARLKNGTYIDLLSKKLPPLTTATNSDSNTIKPQYSPTHAFLSLLQSHKKLLTNFSQNIDSLEFAAGVKPSKVIQCHGTWDTATCMTCDKTIPAKKYLPIVYESGYPRCKCGGADVQTVSPFKKRRASQKKGTAKRKRAIYEGDSDHSSDDGATTPRGLFKPDITFFGEPISESYAPRLAHDKPLADLLIIIGTSLKVRPIKTMVVDFPPEIPQIWINRDRFSGTNSDMPGVQVDIELLGECDVVVEELCRRVGWELGEFLWKGEDGSNGKIGGVKPLGVVENEVSMTIRKHPGSTPTKPKKTPDANGISVSRDILTKPEPESNPSNSPPPSSQGTSTSTTSTVKITSDIDAEWRWRFTKTET